MDAKFLGGQYANPIPADGVFDSDSAGLTKRELFAAMAMQGYIANHSIVDGKDAGSWVAAESVKCADALLAELVKERP